MERDTEALLLRVFVGESDHWHGKPLHLALIQQARESGLAGATAVRGVEGYGARSVIHTARLLEMSSDLPIVVEIVDKPEKIEGFLDTVAEMVSDGMATLEKVQVLFYRAGKAHKG
jgi:hypothetical protein